MSGPTRADAAGRAYLDLQNTARRQQRPTQELLELYALEGLLVRLAASAHRSALVLKGGMLLSAYGVRRPTRDVDFLAKGIANDRDVVLALLREVAAHPGDDGLVFDTSAASAEVIRDEDEYTGVRVSMRCRLARAELAFHVDVNVGDPVWPPPGVVEVPGLLGGVVRLLGYPISAVHAEKIVTALQRGTGNTRWRDFADIYLLCAQQDVDGGDLIRALGDVATHRQVVLAPLSEALVDTPSWPRDAGVHGCAGSGWRTGCPLSWRTYSRRSTPSATPRCEPRSRAPAGTSSSRRGHHPRPPHEDALRLTPGRLAELAPASSTRGSAHPRHRRPKYAPKRRQTKKRRRLRRTSEAERLLAWAAVAVVVVALPPYRGLELGDAGGHEVSIEAGAAQQVPPPGGQSPALSPQNSWPATSPPRSWTCRRSGPTSCPGWQSRCRATGTHDLDGTGPDSHRGAGSAGRAGSATLWFTPLASRWPIIQNSPMVAGTVSAEARVDRSGARYATQVLRM